VLSEIEGKWENIELLLVFLISQPNLPYFQETFCNMNNLMTHCSSASLDLYF
jgi:hypothetical protein